MAPCGAPALPSTPLRKIGQRKIHFPRLSFARLHEDFQECVVAGEEPFFAFVPLQSRQCAEGREVGSFGGHGCSSMGWGSQRMSRRGQKGNGTQYPGEYIPSGWY